MQEKAEALAREKEDERDEARREIHELEARIRPSLPPLSPVLTHALSRSSLALEQVREGRGGAREEERGAGARV